MPKTISDIRLTLEEGYELKLKLTDLRSGAPGITPAFGEGLAEAASVCLEDREHSSPTPMQISGEIGEQQRGGKPRHGYQRRRAESVCPPDSSLPDSVDLYLREPALTANPVFPVQDTPNRKASEHRMFVAGAEEPEYRSYRAMWAPQSRR